MESSNPAFAKAIVRINVFRNHRQVGHPPPLLMSHLRPATGIVVGRQTPQTSCRPVCQLLECLPALGICTVPQQ